MGNPMPLPTHVQIHANMKVIGTENYKDEAHIVTYTKVRQIIFNRISIVQANMLVYYRERESSERKKEIAGYLIMVLSLEAFPMLPYCSGFSHF
jgi:hypothetical protein